MSDWKEKQKKLAERTKGAVENRESRGLGRKTVLDLGLIKLPQYTMKKQNYIDIMPWYVTQPWYRTLRTRSGLPTGLDVGDVDYKLEVAVHKNVGPQRDMFLCIREAFGQSDPICDDMFAEYAKRAEGGGKDFNKEKARALQPSWRNFYIVWDYEDERKVFFLWDISYELFEKFLLEELKTSVEPGGLLIPWDILDGRSIEFKGREKTIGKNSFFEAHSFTFHARDPYTEKDLEGLPHLDQALIRPGYEEIRVAHYGLQDSDSSEEGEKSPEEQKPEGPPVGRTRGGAAAATSSETDVCPAGGKFGEDCNRIPACAAEACSVVVYERCLKSRADLDKRAAETVPLQNQKEETKPAEVPPGGRRRGGPEQSQAQQSAGTAGQRTRRR